MEVRIKTTNCKLDNDAAEYLDTRLQALEKMLGRDAAMKTRCEVEIGKAGGNKHSSDYMWYAEVRLLTTGEKPLYARNHAQNVNAAIDDVKREMQRQVRKEKGVRKTEVKKKGKEVKRALRG